MRIKSSAISALTLILTLTTLSFAGAALQDDENDPAKALALVRAAVKARGGDTYLQVKTVISRGQYTSYDKGVSGNPAPFVDYVAYPNRERTEFGKGDDKFVQTNSEI